ncbi:hypothetical protein NPIL_154921 [Nephila pilipes]|uniref:Uncharacterized protein n=1 Tax=Nephila pilipes TaxID=299642 RepID=A0A8X6TXB0_NEPPI|nr:hypothetical protein NPIL_154921 [Nephila pilipes]
MTPASPPLLGIQNSSREPSTRGEAVFLDLNDTIFFLPSVASCAIVKKRTAIASDESINNIMQFSELSFCKCYPFENSDVVVFSEYLLKLEPVLS